MVPDDGSDLTYSCTVKTQRNNRTASFRAPLKQSEALSWELIGGLIAAAAVAGGVTGVLVWAIKKGNREQAYQATNGSSQEETTEEVEMRPNYNKGTGEEEENKVENLLESQEHEKEPDTEGTPKNEGEQD